MKNNKKIINLALAGTIATMGVGASLSTGVGNISSAAVSNNSSVATYTVNTSTANLIPLNVRSGPGTNYAAVGKIPNGESVTGTVSNGWIKITSGAYAGKYASGTYLDAVKIPAPTTPTTNTTPTTSTSVDALRAKIVATAKTQLGVPYVWGGTTAYKGLDCSGLTQWVYKTNGINLSRTTYTQIAEMKKITAATAKPGDLIFFSNYVGGPAEHVGIIVDPVAQTYIHAPKPGDVVKIANYKYFNQALVTYATKF